MSHKTLRLSNDSTIVLTAERFALRRLHVACAIGLLALAPVSSFALELGEAAIRSSLGQSLLVDIPYRLAAEERLTPECISLVPAARPERALPTYSHVRRIAITPTHIEIFGDSRVLEPLIGVTVDVHCATAPRFVRSYQLFVDPPARIPALLSNGIQVATARADAPTPVAESQRAPRAIASARARGQTGGLLIQGQTYLVVRGDTLSGIAARIGDRPTTIREAAEAIFAANPESFTRGNRDLIEAGRPITIPIMTGSLVTLPAPPAATPLPAIREAGPASTTSLPSADLPSAPTIETPPLRGEAIASVVVPETVESSATDVTVVQPSAAPVPMTGNVTPERASPATAGRASAWLTALLALGVVAALSAPVLFIRRRKHEARVPARATPRTAPRRLVDPVAGFDVVEGQLARTPDPLPVPVPVPVPVDIGLTDSVDLDVGVPVPVGQRADWFGDRADTAPTANSTVADATIEHAATARMPELDSAATAAQQTLEPTTDVSEPAVDDEHHTLTIVEIDMLREDYEAEHTLTQAGSQSLRDALADLKATQAALAAGAATATLEMPQPEAETMETQQTQRLRSSR